MQLQDHVHLFIDIFFHRAKTLYALWISYSSFLSFFYIIPEYFIKFNILRGRNLCFLKFLTDLLKTFSFPVLIHFTVIVSVEFIHVDPLVE